MVLDHAAKKPRLSLVGPQILQILQQPETDDPANHHTKWRPEYASYMIEGLAEHVTPWENCAHVTD